MNAVDAGEPRLIQLRRRFGLAQIVLALVIAVTTMPAVRDRSGSAQAWIESALADIADVTAMLDPRSGEDADEDPLEGPPARAELQGPERNADLSRLARASGDRPRSHRSGAHQATGPPAL